MQPVPPHRTPSSADSTSRPAVTVVERIVRDLRQQIDDGELQPDDRVPSSRQLAEQYGVSINTVQAALGRLEAIGLVDCSPRRRAVVRETATRRRRGRGSTGLTLMFGEPGANYSDFNTSWGSQILYAAEHALSLRGIAVAKIYVPQIDGKIPSHELQKVESLLKNAAAVIWLASAGLQPHILEAINRGVPCVTINAPSDIVEYNLIKADNVGGGRTAGQVFARLGYHRCLLLTRGIRYRRFAPELAQGFLDSFMKAGIPLRGIDYVDLAEDSSDLAQRVVGDYLADNQPPQAIFAVSDVIALGAMAACRDAGLSIPGDVGVLSATGFEPVCCQATPSLSAWRQPTRQMGERAVEMLLRLMQNPGDHLPPQLVESSLVLRGSLPRHNELIDIPGIEIPSFTEAEHASPADAPHNA